MSALAERVCVPCRGGIPPLTPPEFEPLLAQIEPAWSVGIGRDRKGRDYAHLTRTYDFENFAEAMAFAVRVGGVAEEQQHHPDLHVAWGKVGVDLWTHKIAGLTESDFVFAAKCDVLYATT